MKIQRRPLPGLVALPSPTKPLVLVVDDDAGVREALRLILEQEYGVVDAADGSAALSAVRAGPVDLVLLDILLPGVDGIEILKKLKTAAPGTPVIMVTGVKTIQTSVAAMKLGAVDYITKPFQDEELLGLVRGAIVPRRVLVVDSDRGRRATLSVMLARFAAEVATAEDPQGLDRLSRAPTLCAALGLGQGRTAAMRIVRSVRARFAGCPIIAALERDDSNTVRDLEALGVDEILRPGAEVTDVIRRAGSLLSVSSGPPHTALHFSASATQAIKYVGANHAEKLSIDTIARAVDVSGSHLARVFREETGMAVMDFVTRVRVDVAKHLLTTTRHDLAQVAADAGFFDASHLSRAFLLITGRRPGFYRQSSR